MHSCVGVFLKVLYYLMCLARNSQGVLASFLMLFWLAFVDASTSSLFHLEIEIRGFVFVTTDLRLAFVSVLGLVIQL